MRKFIRIFLLALFLAMGSIGYGYCDPGNGGGWGQGVGGGKGHGVPEIDPSFAWSGVAILGGGVVILAERYRRKRKRSK
jgi:hypothetical protein